MGSEVFRNKHGNGAVRITTPALRPDHLAFAKESVKGDYTVNVRRNFPAVWRFASLNDAVIFKLRFSEEARTIA